MENVVRKQFPHAQPHSLKMKDEKVDELTAAAEAVRARMLLVCWWFPKYFKCLRQRLKYLKTKFKAQIRGRNWANRLRGEHNRKTKITRKS